MSLFSRLRRSTSGYTSNSKTSSSYSSRGSRRRHERHERRERERLGLGGSVPHISCESIPYLPSETTTRGASSEVSLRSEYTHLDNDTNRYPKFVPTVPGPPTTKPKRRVSVTHRETELNGRTTESQISPMLAVTLTPIMWDVRDSPAHMRQYRHTHRVDDIRAPALSTQSQYLCIISPDFPWTVAISTNDGRALTILDVVEALYESLNKEVRRSEWALASDVQRYTMLKANKARRRSEAAMRIRRVDWLGTRCMFRGLERDEELVRRRLMPGDHPGEMWVVRFGSGSVQ